MRSLHNLSVPDYAHSDDNYRANVVSKNWYDNANTLIEFVSCMPIAIEICSHTQTVALNSSATTDSYRLYRSMHIVPCGVGNYHDPLFM